MLLTTPAANVPLANPLRLVRTRLTSAVLTDAQLIVLAALPVKPANLLRLKMMITIIPAVPAAELAPIPAPARVILLQNQADRLVQRQQSAGKPAIITARHLIPTAIPARADIQHLVQTDTPARHLKNVLAAQLQGLVTNVNQLLQNYMNMSARRLVNVAETLVPANMPHAKEPEVPRNILISTESVTMDMNAGLAKNPITIKPILQFSQKITMIFLGKFYIFLNIIKNCFL